MNRLMGKSSSSDTQAKFIQNRISHVEKHFAAIANALKKYITKMDSMRCRGDALAKTITHFCEAEQINKSTKEHVSNVADNLYAVEDYRNAEVNRLSLKVASMFMMYESFCKVAKDELKSAFALQSKEMNQKKSLERLREKNPDNRHQIMLAESELLKVSAEASKSGKLLEERMDAFEAQKLENLKSILLDWMKIELSFHCKAIELFTKACQEVNEIDLEADLAEFEGAYKDAQNSSQRDGSFGGLFGSGGRRSASSPTLGGRKFNWGGLKPGSKNSLPTPKGTLKDRPKPTPRKSTPVHTRSAHRKPQESEEDEDEYDEEVEEEEEEEEDGDWDEVEEEEEEDDDRRGGRKGFHKQSHSDEDLSRNKKGKTAHSKGGIRMIDPKRRSR